MTPDQFNTPISLSKKMVGCVRVPRPRVIADFSAGSGELLKAASDRWKTATMIALDIDERMVRKLRRQQPLWIVSRGDFLSPNSVSRCAALKQAGSGIDLILLNPPFSSRGGSRSLVAIGRNVLSCSRAVAFLISSLRFLSSNGELVAIVPAGSMRSEKDRTAWALLHENFNITVIGTNGHKAFEGCFPQTTIIRISRRNVTTVPVKESIRQKVYKQAHPIVLYRGKLPMHELKNGGSPLEVPLLHSTCLRNGSVDFAQFRASNAGFKISGPAVLLVRVGEPNRDKVVFYRGRNTFALSDCIIALKARRTVLKTLHQELIRSWRSLLSLYRGTGAKYITVGEVAGLLRSKGFLVRHPARNAGHKLVRAIGCPEYHVSSELRENWLFYLRKHNDKKN